MEAKAKNQTLEEIRISGLEALLKHLGIVGMIRFLQYQDKGHGDYSRERHTWLGEPDMETIGGEIEKMRK